MKNSRPILISCTYSAKLFQQGIWMNSDLPRCSSFLERIDKRPPRAELTNRAPAIPGSASWSTGQPEDAFRERFGRVHIYPEVRCSSGERTQTLSSRNDQSFPSCCGFSSMAALKSSRDTLCPPKNQCYSVTQLTAQPDDATGKIPTRTVLVERMPCELTF